MGQATEGHSRVSVAGMSFSDMGVAAVVAAVWGLAFVVSKIGLQAFTPAQLTFLRFTIAALAVVCLPRPKVSWKTLLIIGSTVFAGQFLLQFLGIKWGMPAGLTAVVSQSQALFTVFFASVLLRERPARAQITGLLVAACGLVAIGSGLDRQVPLLAFVAVLLSAVSWAAGNVFIKRLPRTDMLQLMVWASLVPPLPALALTLIFDGSTTFINRIASASLIQLLAPVYLGLVATVAAYAAWGRLLQRLPAASVTPFALLAPCTGAIASATLLGETFTFLQIVGMVTVLVGVLTSAVFSAPQASKLPERPEKTGS